MEESIVCCIDSPIQYKQTKDDDKSTRMTLSPFEFLAYDPRNDYKYRKRDMKESDLIIHKDISGDIYEHFVRDEVNILLYIIRLFRS